MQELLNKDIKILLSTVPAWGEMIWSLPEGHAQASQNENKHY
jgi:hypothetical protein